MSLIVAALTVLLTAQDPGCADDQGRDRCTPEDRARVEALLGMPSIEADAETGAEVYRARFVDGYGRDMPAVAFERRPGSSPQVVVYLSGARRMTGAVPAGVWEEVRTASRYADRALAPEGEAGTPPDQAPFNLCLHAWIVGVEMANSPEGARVRRRQESACGGQLTARFGFELAERAVPLLPSCAVLDADDFRNDITRLGVCGRLEGDTAAAASLMNQIGHSRAELRADLEPALAWGAWMGVNNQATLDWMGETYRNERKADGRRADAFLAAKQAEMEGLTPFMERFRGVDGRRVETTGALVRRVDDRSELARFAQVWVWDVALNEWMLESWTVQPFQPVG